MLKEFQEFALKGNVVDLAIGVIIGAAFGKIVESMVGDIIMPFIGIFGSVDFSNLYLVLKGSVPAGASLEEARKAGVVLAYGNFLTIVVNFTIIAFVLFQLVKGMNRLKREMAARAAAAPPVPEVAPADVQLLTEIRDLLAKR